MPIRRRPKKRNAEPRQNSKYRQSVIDPLVNPGSPPHRHQARPKADPARTHHRMVLLAQSSPGCRSMRSFQIKKATVMLGSVLEEASRQARREDERTYALRAGEWLRDRGLLL